jgi:four helix bundle protein
MATVKRFEELEVYKLGMEIFQNVWTMCRNLPRTEFALADQMKRSALSIISNIAEGYERNSRKEFIQFCYIAKGSVGELRAQLEGCYSVGLLNKEKYEQVRTLCFRESGALASFIEYLRRTSKGKTENKQTSRGSLSHGENS